MVICASMKCAFSTHVYIGHCIMHSEAARLGVPKLTCTPKYISSFCCPHYDIIAKILAYLNGLQENRLFHRSAKECLT